MTAISITDLNNAKTDVDHIAEISTSVALTSTDRLGHVKDTLTGAMYKVSAFNSRGAWVTATAYAIKDLVSNAGTWYVCVVAHTSSAAFATDTATKWRVYQGITSGDLGVSSGSILVGDDDGAGGSLWTTIRGFIVRIRSSAGASVVGFIQAGIGAILRTLQAKVREIQITPFDYGAVGDGVTDDTAAFFAALVAANGRAVTLPSGFIYRITQPLSNSTATAINLVGETPAFLSHPIINAAQLNNDPLYHVTGTGTPGSSIAVSAAAENAYMLATCPGVAIIKCDGCNLIGVPDTGTANYSNQKLKVLRNIVAWGINGAKIGVYESPMDQIVENNTFVLFEYFGILHRGGITTNLHKNAFVDCGWNLAASGTITYPNTYTSGCAIKVCSNFTANDYTTITGAYRATTWHSSEHSVWQRGYTANNKSGLRGVQAHGCLSMTIDKATQYTGDFFDICQVSVDGYHYENYHTGGAASGDHIPMNIYAINTQIDIGMGFSSMVGAGITAGSPVWVIKGTGVSFLPQYCSNDRSIGFTKSIGPAYSDMDKGVVVGPGGTTQTYTLKNVLTTGNGGGSKGFLGMVAVQLNNANNFNNFSRGIWAVARHLGGVEKIMTPVQIAYESSVSGAFAATLTANFVGNDLVVSVTFGASWGPSEGWYLNAGMFGIPTISV